MKNNERKRRMKLRKKDRKFIKKKNEMNLKVEDKKE